jgi:hypothetical protein
MNDLAEKALRGLDVARRRVRDRPLLALGALGFALAAVIVVAGGEVGAARATRPLADWLGLQDTHGAESGDPGPGTVMLAAVVALVGVWLLTVEVVRRVGPASRRVWFVAGAWAFPFAVGPPLMDTSVYGYTAFGLVQRNGWDPYDHGPAVLGSRAIVAAVDPGARGTPSGVGPLGTLLQHLAVSIAGGSPLGAVVVLRVVGVLAFVALGWFAAQLAGRRPERALTLTVLNPLVLLYVVSSPHLDGVMIALLLAALVAAAQRRWLRAIVLACVAGSVSGQAFVAVPAIVVAHWLGRRRAPAWLLLGRDVLVAAATTIACGLLADDGFGWLWTVSKQFPSHPPFSISNALAKLLAAIVRGASYDDLAAGARITTMTAMVVVIGYFLVTSRQRPLERTVGYSLLALGLLAPVLYPWYLLWGCTCLAPTAAGVRRIVVLALCAVGCVLVPPGFSPLTANVLTGVALVVALLAALAAVHPPALVRRPARRVSDPT